MSAAAPFHSTLNILLSSFQWKSCLVYIDDVIIFSRNFESDMKQVQNILAALPSAGVFLKLRKCNFFSDSVQYLCHVIKLGSLSAHDLQGKGLKGLQHPRNLTELRSFLGL